MLAVWPDPWFVANGALDHVNAQPPGLYTPTAFRGFASAAGLESTTWNLNLTTRASTAPAFIEHLAAIGEDVKRVEMDNETYFWGAVFGGSEGGQKYADAVNAVAPTVRRVFPDAQIGMVADSHGLFVEEGGDAANARRRDWNRHVTAQRNRDSYDVLVLHHYEMGAGRLAAFDTDAAATRSAFLAFPQATMQRAEAEIAEKLGDAPIWLTEFNVLYNDDFGGSASTASSRPRPTPGGTRSTRPGSRCTRCATPTR